MVMCSEYVFTDISDPDGIDVADRDNGWLATFTRDAYSVILRGPTRTLVERAARVRNTVWVRTYPAPFNGEVDIAWLEEARDANQHKVPDVIAIAMQYVRDAPALFDGNLQIAGDAQYGPLVDGKREEGSDFNDYLGVRWTYPDGKVDRPEANQLHCLDCSGFVRMVWGYRHHLAGRGYEDTLPLSLRPQANGAAIPRRAFEILENAPGVLITSNSGAQITDFSRLRVGDLVFFDADAEDGPQIDHVGMYLGVDNNDRHRFISSRKGANGPTLADFKGKSVLDGTGLYAQSFRGVRRL